MIARYFAALALSTALYSRPVLADAAPPKPPPSSPICAQEPTALGRSACTLSQALPALAHGALVISAATLPAPNAAPPSAISRKLTELLAARLGPDASADLEARSLADAKRRGSTARGFVYLTISLRRDRLEVSADAYVGAGQIWQRVRSPGFHLAAHAFSTTPLDAELRALFPAIPLVVSRIDKAVGAEPGLVALACGDVRGDGSTEIAAIGRQRIQVGRIEHGRFVARASANWPDLSGIAARPLREPIASSTIPEPGLLWVGSSDRADALALSDSLTLLHQWHGVMPWPGGGCTRRSGLGYQGQTHACPGHALFPPVDFGSVVDTFASRTLTNAAGQNHTLKVARTVGSNTARVLDSLHAEVVIPDAGAALAVGDLDDDGLPEIVTTSSSLDRHADQLVVRTLTNAGQLRERLRIDVPSGIDAIAICPSDGRAMAPVVAATGNGIWVIQ